MLSQYDILLVMSDESNTNGENVNHKTVESAPDIDKKPKTARKVLLALGLIVGVALVLAGGTVGYLYATTPISVRQPLYEHYHYRMSLIVNGKEEDFGSDKYQEGYSKDNCNATLTQHPIHFHDNRNHFVHIHWEGMTGGQVLKYYGWNFIGGSKQSLGQRFDSGARLQTVPIHGNVLPAIPNDANFYVYTGSATDYKSRSFDDFTKQDLEQFFGKASNSPAHELNKQKRSGLQLPRASAQAAADHQEHSSDTNGLSGVDLQRLNNLIGDVVIFVQANEPTRQQITERFNGLEPLSESSCAG